ncbi:MAG: hypothetical protein LUD68_02535 [Rikenellaceae bacterium]|nr:hypothetical protein [Rikenellaceae bacterium]
MKRDSIVSLIGAFLVLFAFSCKDDKEMIGLLRDIDLEYDGEVYDLGNSTYSTEKILYIYRNNEDQYVNYTADKRISLDKGTYQFVAAFPIDSGMPAGNLHQIMIPLPTTATQKLVVSDPTTVKMPGDESVTLNLKTRTGTIVIAAQDEKSDRRYNSIDIRTTVSQNGYMSGTQTYLDGTADIVKRLRLPAAASVSEMNFTSIRPGIKAVKCSCTWTFITAPRPIRC